MIRPKLMAKSDRSIMIIEGNRVLSLVVLFSGRRVRNGGKAQPKHDEGKR